MVVVIMCSLDRLSILVESHPFCAFRKPFCSQRKVFRERNIPIVFIDGIKHSSLKVNSTLKLHFREIYWPSKGCHPVTDVLFEYGSCECCGGIKLDSTKIDFIIKANEAE